MYIYMMYSGYNCKPKWMRRLCDGCCGGAVDGSSPIPDTQVRAAAHSPGPSREEQHLH